LAARTWERPHADAQAAALTSQAERCRRLAEVTYNREMAEMLRLMAEDYERTIEELSSKGVS
jgi:hypothetical protein